MLYKITFSILLLFLVSCSGNDDTEDAQQFCADFQLQSGDYDAVEDFKMINVASSAFYEIDGQVHVDEHTEHLMTKEDVRSFLDSAEIPFNEEALNAYGIANQESAFFKRSPTPENIVLISGDELDCFFYDENARGWDDFYKKYPDSYGLLSFSKPGISANGNSAIILRFRTNGRIMAFGPDFAGSILILSKVNGVWQIDEVLVFAQS